MWLDADKPIEKSDEGISIGFFMSAEDLRKEVSRLDSLNDLRMCEITSCSNIGKVGIDILIKFL